MSGFFTGFSLLLYLVFFVVGFTSNILSLDVYQGHDIGSYAIAMPFFATAIFLVGRVRRDILASSRVFYILLIVAFGLRVLAQFSLPTTTDLARYHSDGQTILAGESPFQKKPPSHVAFDHLTSVYPFLAQAFFALGALLSQERLVYKLVFGLVELSFLAWFFLVFLYKRKRSRSRMTNWYFFLLNPLSIFEFHKEGHLEILPIFLLIVAFHYYRCSRRLKQSLATAILAFASKFYGILLFPFFFLKRRKHNLQIRASSRLVYGMICLLTVILILLPFRDYFGLSESHGLRAYFKHWYFAHPLLAFFKETMAMGSQAIIRVCQALITIVAGFALFKWWSGKATPLRYLIVCISGFLFFFPVQHPWYFSLAFLVVIYSHRYRLFWQMITSLISLNYLNYTGVLSAEWMGLVWLLALFLFWSRRMIFFRSAVLP